MSNPFNRLYDKDPYLTTFTAVVHRCSPKGKHFQVELDQTAFYPESGGQPADTGTLGDAQVLDVHTVDGAIVHLTDRSLTVGSTVVGRIDWDRRFTLMQQHSGEHILSGVVKRLFGFDNVGFHIGTDGMTIDFSGELSDEDLKKAERLSNEAVYRNLPVRVDFPAPEERIQLDYRSKIELGDDVRLVTIPETDCCACCGTHVQRTGEIGIVKVLTRQKYKGGTRLNVVCGMRALADYVQKNDQSNTLSTLLSLKPTDIIDGVVRLQAESSVLKSTNTRLREQIIDLKVEALVSGTAQSAWTASGAADEPGSFLPDAAEAGDRTRSGRTRRLVLFEEDLSPDDLRLFASRLASRADCTAAVFSGREGERYRYALASTREDMRSFSKSMNGALKGAGGGSSELVQGSVSVSRQSIETFIHSGEMTNL